MRLVSSRLAAHRALAMVAGGLALLASSPASAEPRFAETLHGGILVVGNTLVQSCAGDRVAPIQGPNANDKIIDCTSEIGPNAADGAADLFWSLSPLFPTDGTVSSVRANATVAPADMGSSVGLSLPPGATLKHARLYFGATLDDATPPTFPASFRLDSAVQFSSGKPAPSDVFLGTLGPNGESHAYVATIAYGPPFIAQSDGGRLALRSAVAQDLRQRALARGAAGWAMVLVYELPTEPLRRIEIHDAAPLGPNGKVITGSFYPPKTGPKGTLGLFGLGAQATTVGSITANGQKIGDAANPVDSILNGTRSRRGQSAAHERDFPAFGPEAGALSGTDVDELALDPYLSTGRQTLTLAPNVPDAMLGVLAVALDTEPDTDGDGLFDAEEEALKSDPALVDTDGDGWPDGQELSPGSDTDGDGLPNILDPDSDGDGIRDGIEVSAPCVPGLPCIPDTDPLTKTNPLVADTDGDGRKDGEEDLNRNGRIDAGETDPNNPSDGGTAGNGGSAGAAGVGGIAGAAGTGGLAGSGGLGGNASAGAAGMGGLAGSGGIGGNASAGAAGKSGASGRGDVGIGSGAAAGSTQGSGLGQGSGKTDDDGACSVGHGPRGSSLTAGGLLLGALVLAVRRRRPPCRKVD